MKIIYFIYLIFILKISATIISIDFGTEFITTSIVDSIKPIVLIESPMSSTKVRQYLSILPNSISFDIQAKQKISKYPSLVFHHLQYFLGKTYDNKILQNYLKNNYIQYDNIEIDDKNKRINFKVFYNNKNYLISSELILSLMIKNIKTYSDSFSKTIVNQAVFSIPNFYTYKQRESIINAFEINGLRLNCFIQDNLAASIKYFNDKRFDKDKKFFIFYNMGASFIQVSLISVKSLYDGSKKDLRETQIISVIDEEYNENLGGKNFDIVLSKIIYKKIINDEKFNDFNSNIIHKILPYALKAKEMLSANKEISIKVAYSNNEYTVNITRNEFYNNCEDLFSQIYTPLDKILKNNININSVIQIEFIGGGHRIPRIKEIIKENLIKNYKDLKNVDSKIGVHLNGDDVVALGAGIYAKILSGYNVIVNNMKKNVKLEGNGYPFETRILVDNIESNNLCDEHNDYKFDENYDPNKNNYCVKPIHKNATLFKPFSNLSHDLSVSVGYDNNLIITLIQRNIPIIKYRLNSISNDIKEIIKNNPTIIKNEGDVFRIKLLFKIDKLGVFKLKPEIIYKIKNYYTLIKGNKISFRYLNKLPTKTYTDDEINDLIKEVEKSKDYSESEKKSILKTLKEKNFNNLNVFKTEKKAKYLTVLSDNNKNNNVNYIEPTFPLPLNMKEIENDKSILKEIEKKERENNKYNEKKNTLEKMIYDKRDFIQNKQLHENYATEEEIKSFEKEFNEIFDWFNKNIEEQLNIKIIDDKINLIKEIYKKFEDRKIREKKRENNIKYFYSEIESGTKQVKSWFDEKPWIKKYFTETFEKKVNQMKEWMKDLEEKQKKLKEYEEPIINKEELNQQLEDLRKEVKKIKNMPRPIAYTDL